MGWISEHIALPNQKPIELFVHLKFQKIRSMQWQIIQW